MKLFPDRKKINDIINSASKWQIKLFFVVVAISMVITVVLYTRVLVDDLILREQQSIKLYAEIFKKLTESDANIDDVNLLIEQITPTISFPIITTDDKDEPIYPFEQWTLNVKIDSSQSVSDQRASLKTHIEKMKSNYPPIIVEDQDKKVLNKFYYTHSSLIDNFQLFPVIEIFIVIIFVLIGYIAFSNIRRNEESKVWVGMAKEAAHQLGTPLSSILAWLEIIRYNKDNPESIEETLTEMEHDVNRLNIIATRFSKIGSKPEKKPEKIAEIIENTSKYFEKRLPHLGRKVEIVRNLDFSIIADINSELFAWVIENLLKNAAEAIDNRRGVVKIEMYNVKNRLSILITDNGKGMTMKQKRQVFHPGFTTKKRGWGLGLTLCKRIISDYHDGKIFIKDTSPGKGTTFAIEIPLNFTGGNYAAD